MSGPVTAEAPANIAFVKYWGARDLERAVPVNPSISMTLRRCVSTTTARLLDERAGDEVWIADGEGDLTPASGSFRQRAVAHLGTLREWAGRSEAVALVTRNSFPAAAGLASSASGFAALTLAVTALFGEDPSPEVLSELARRSGSGSASRSVLGGYVEWPVGDPERCAAAQLAPADHWDLRDVVALVQRGPKAISSLDGHVRAPTSPHFETRQRLLGGRLQQVRSAIRERSLERLGPVLEEDAIELHLIAMSSSPPIFYWQPATLRVLERVRQLRRDDVGAWMTMDAGANVHVICAPESEEAVAEALDEVDGVHGVIRDGVGAGPRLLENHLPAPDAAGRAS